MVPLKVDGAVPDRSATILAVEAMAEHDRNAGVYEDEGLGAK